MVIKSVAVAAKSTHRQSSFGRYLLAAAILSGCVWFMMQAASYGLRAVLPPPIGLKLAPHSPEAQIDAAEVLLAAGRKTEAARLARASIIQAPFNARALRILGIASAEENEGLADRLITLAGSWSLRDDQSHAWLMMRRAQQGQNAAVLAHADLLVRRRPELYDSIFPIFDGFAAEPGGADLVAQRLMLKPDWRSDYFARLAKSAQLSVGLQVARALKTTSAPPTPSELGALYGALLQQKRYVDLEAFHEAMAGKSAPLIRDGDFPLRGDPPPLGWWFAQAPGFDVQVLADNDRTGQSVLVLRHDGFTPGGAASQVLLLPAGQWRFSGRVRWVSRSSSQPPVWRLTCLEGVPIAAPGEVAAIGDPGRWADFSAIFSVPQGCPTQELELIALAGERRQDAEVEFDDIRIQAQ
jgi:hypothetical protein